MTCLCYSFIHWFIFFSFYLLLFSCVFCIYDSSLLKPRQVMVIVSHLNDSLSRLKFPTPLCFPSRNTRYGTRFYRCVTSQIGTVLNLPIRAPRSPIMVYRIVINLILPNPIEIKYLNAMVVGMLSVLCMMFVVNNCLFIYCFQAFFTNLRSWPRLSPFTTRRRERVLFNINICSYSVVAVKTEDRV